MTEPDLSTPDKDFDPATDPEFDGGAPESAAEPEPTPEPEDEPDPKYDPETQVITEDGKVQDMPSGAWTAALTPAGNLRRKKGLLVLAPEG